MKIVIDSNALAHRARFAMKGSNLSTDRMRTEVIYGFLNAVNDAAEFLGSNEIIFVWDADGSWRKVVYAAYKNKPEKGLEEKEFDALTIPQFNTIKDEILPEMGFKNIFFQHGLEADDIIAAITKGYTEESFIILSRDGDLYQLLTDKVMMYDPISKNFITQQTVFQQWGIEAERWWEVKSIAGCRTDKVEGVSGVGEKTAIKYLLNRLPRTTKAYHSIENSQGVIKRNTNLVKLPFDGTKVPTLLPDELSLDKFKAIFEKYNFQSFLYRINEWVRNFKL